MRLEVQGELLRAAGEPQGHPSEGIERGRAVVGLGHTLGLRVVADGVATAATARALREARCDGFQGSHVAPAMDAAALAGWLAAERARADGVA